MYTIALSVVAIIAVLSQMVIQNNLSHQENGSHVINIAGRQRLLSQQVSKLSLQTLLKSDKPIYVELKSVLTIWEKNQKLLSRGTKTEKIKKLSPAILAEYKKVTPFFKKVVEGVNGLISLEKENISSLELKKKFVSQILDNEKEYLSRMDAIVFALAHEAEEKLESHKRIELFLMGILLLALILEIFFIFNPVAKKIKSVIGSLISAESRATKMANEMNQLNISLKKTDKDVRDINFALEKGTILIKTDREGIITYANDRYCSITKYSEEELTGRPLFFNNQGGAESIVYDHIRDNNRYKTIWQGEVFDNAKDSSNFWLDVNMIPIVSLEGELYQYLVICSDITKRKNAETQLQLVTERKFNRKMSEQKDRSNSVILGQEQERKRMAREIHDGVGQMLTALKFNCEALMPNDDKQDRLFISIKDLLQSVIREVRRISSDLLPTVLADFGLVAAIKEMIQILVTAGHPIPIILHTNEDFESHRLNKTIEISLYRIVQETVNNALKYSQATIINVRLDIDAEFINLTISDDGKGFNPDEAIQRNRHKTTGNGLTSMRERAELINGKLSIESKLQEGTTILVEVPLDDYSYE